MTQPNRLDVVVRVREREEQQRLEKLGQLQRAEVEAAERARLAAERAKQGPDSAMDAARWLVEEQGRHRSVLEARRARRQADQAKTETDRARAQYTVAYQRAEVVRRVADARRAEYRAEADRKETRAEDDVAALAFALKRAG